MRKPYPALCKDCKWSYKPSDTYSLRCSHPRVNANDAWALGSVTTEGELYGKGCTYERGWSGLLGWFAPCGMKGKLWEPKDRHVDVIKFDDNVPF